MKLRSIGKKKEVIEDDFGAPEECLKCLEAKDIIAKLITLLQVQAGKTYERAKEFIK